MIAQKATEAINMAVCYELQNIVKDHGAVYNSGHEAYAILKEEKEEAVQCVAVCDKFIETLGGINSDKK